MCEKQKRKEKSIHFLSLSLKPYAQKQWEVVQQVEFFSTSFINSIAIGKELCFHMRKLIFVHVSVIKIMNWLVFFLLNFLFFPPIYFYAKFPCTKTFRTVPCLETHFMIQLRKKSICYYEWKSWLLWLSLSTPQTDITCRIVVPQLSRNVVAWKFFWPQKTVQKYLKNPEYCKMLENNIYIYIFISPY